MNLSIIQTIMLSALFQLSHNFTLPCSVYDWRTLLDAVAVALAEVLLLCLRRKHPFQAQTVFPGLAPTRWEAVALWSLTT